MPREHPGLDYLGLLKEELIGHVRRARGALDAGEAGAAGGTASAVCADAMHQVQGVLRTLGLERLALLAEALALAARELGGVSPERREDLVAILRNGLDQLRDGVEQRAAGRPEAVWGLVAALNDLRASLALPLVSETCLFAPGLEAVLAGAAPALRAGGDTLEDAARRERVVLHRALYLWYSGREPERGLRKLRRVANALQQTAASGPLQRLFLALEAMVVAVADGSIVAGAGVRRVFAAVDQLLRRIGETGEAAVAAAPPVELLRDLLFYVAGSGSSHRLVRAATEGGDLRLVTATGCDGRDEAAALLLPDVERLRARTQRAEAGGPTTPVLAELAAAVQRLSDGLALADLGDERRQLGDPLEALRCPGADAGGAASGRLAGLAEVLARLEAGLRAYALGVATAEAEPAGPASEGSLVAQETTIVEEEVAAVDDELERSTVAVPPVPSAVAPPDPVRPLDDEIREVFLDEAAEKVEAMRQHYVAWSAQREDGSALDAVLAALDSLKSTGRLVGADTLSEVCWVLQAALRACRDGTLTATDEALAVLDDGVEMVDALVGAHVRGMAVEGDPRQVEQRIYALLTPTASAAPAESSPVPVSRQPALESRPPPSDDLADGPALDADTFEGDLDLVELFAEEAGDLADALEEGLRGLEEDPARSAWLMEMRRALRALAVAARHAELPQLNALCEAFDAFLARTAEPGRGVGPEALALTREATGAVAGVVDALRGRRLPHLPADLVDRLREGAAGAASAAKPGPTPAGGATAAGQAGPAGPPAASPADPALARRVIERASGAGVCHLQLEAQVAVLRDQVGRLEGVLALLRRLPADEAGAALPPRVTSALADLGGCADRLHETSLMISAQLRTQGHHLTGLQQGLAAAFSGSPGPTFADVLLVGIGDQVYAIAAAVVDSVRRLAPDLVPPDGGLLELRGRSFRYRHLGGLLAVRHDAPGDTDRPRSVVLARAADQSVALGVDSVIGHRTLLVTPRAADEEGPPWLDGLAALGGERDALVLDLGRLVAGP